MRKIAESINSNQKKDYTQIKSENQEEDESLLIKVLWFLSGILLIPSDAVEVITGVLNLSSVGILSVLNFLTSFLEYPGVIIFIYLILHYMGEKVIGLPEGSLYIFLVVAECFDFIPIIGAISILPFKIVIGLLARRRIVKSIRKTLQQKREERFRKKAQEAEPVEELQPL